MMRRWLLIALAALSAGFLFAQDDTNPDADPGPGRGVARISVINGEVSVRRGDAGEVVAAAINAPLMAQDALLTSSSSRAEIQLDSSNVLRVGANSEVRMSGLDYKKYQIQVATGIVTFTVLRTSDAQVELDTPSVGVKPLKNGAYRITVHEDGSSEITVRAGQAEIYNQQGSQRLEQGQSMQVHGNPSDPEFQVVQAPQLDAWDRWNADRDQVLTKARSREYVSPDINGAEDLDQYGKWVNDPTYGNVWSPSVAPGWAPYQDGRWVWEDWYGWTWVSNDPWGWAPYHYGRWFNGAAGWCWYPGPIYVRHYWAPAFVGFFGWGGGVGFGFGFANVGWVPLAPFEVFHPWWGRGFGGGRYFNNTTIVNNVNIANIYRNARVANAVSGVGAGEFGRRTGRFSAIGAEQIRTAGLVRGGLPVTPQRSSLQFADRQVNASRFPQTRNDRFFAHSQPATAQRVPFEQQQRSIQQATASRGNFSAAGSRPAGLGNSIGQPGVTSHEWSRFGEPIHGTNGTRPAQQPRAEERFSNGRSSVTPSTGSSNAGNPGWRRFGSPSGGSVASPSRSYEPPSRGSDRPAATPAPRSSGGSTTYTPPSRSNFQPQVSGGGRSSSGWNSSSGPVRISPPIVRERAPSYGGGSFHPAPSYGGGSRPSPSFNGGGTPRSSGGGGGHPSSSGGGGHSSGGHSSGGGGHHGR